MAKLGDLLKISTDPYKRLEVVYSCKRQVVVKNNAGNYVVAFSDRDLNVNDVLFYATKSITENIVLCNQLGKDYVVTIKMSLFYDSKERAIEAIKCNIIKVVRSYDKRVIVKNSKSEYAAVYSKNWRKLKVSDILLCTTMNVSLGVTLYCKRIWEEDSFDIKILSRWHKSIEEIKSLISNSKIKKRNKTITPFKKGNKTITPYKKKDIGIKRSQPWRSSTSSIYDSIGPNARIIYIPMGGQKRY